MTLDFSSLGKAIAQLEEAVAYANSELARSDVRLAPHLRAAAIQAFDYTYELSHKTLQRYLASIALNPAAVAELDFAGLMRAGFARGVLTEEIAAWRIFRRDRGASSHSYTEAVAREVFDGIPRFLAEARFLLNAVRAGTDASP